MTSGQVYDVVVIGGGISGCSSALHLAKGGMSVALIERERLCRAASAANAGTLSIQIKRASLVSYSMRSWQMWRDAPNWLGREVGFVHQGGLTVAFNDDEADMLKERMGERRDAGAPIEFLDGARARAMEPGLTEHVKLASYCEMDAFANSLLTGIAFRTAMVKEGVQIMEDAPVSGIDRESGGFAVRTPAGVVRGRRVVLAGGAWLGRMFAWLGLDVLVEYAPHMVSVTERAPVLMRTVIGIATGLLTIKQKKDGTIVIGGGWDGIGDPDRGGVGIIPENFVGNLRLAHFTIPALSKVRIMRSWVGLEPNSADFMPILGPVPGVDGAFAIGCIRGGYTNGPFFGKLLAQAVLGQEPDMPLFDPGRYVRNRPAQIAG